MITNDSQKGIPFTEYTDTKANIEATASPAVGMVAVATDNAAAPFGAYNGTAWVWIGSGMFMPYVAKTGSYTLTTSDYVVECTANSFTLTLPTAVGFTGRIYQMKNSGTGSITINTTSSQTIDGNVSGTIVLAQYENRTVMSNGANWIIIY